MNIQNKKPKAQRIAIIWLAWQLPKKLDSLGFSIFDVAETLLFANSPTYLWDIFQNKWRKLTTPTWGGNSWVQQISDQKTHKGKNRKWDIHRALWKPPTYSRIWKLCTCTELCTYPGLCTCPAKTWEGPKL